MAVLNTHQILYFHIKHVLDRKPWKINPEILLKISNSRGVRSWSLGLLVYFRSVVNEEMLKLLLEGSLSIVVEFLVQEPHAEIVLLEDDLRKGEVGSVLDDLFVVGLVDVLGEDALFGDGVDLVDLVVDEALEVEVQEAVVVHQIYDSLL